MIFSVHISVLLFTNISALPSPSPEALLFWLLDEPLGAVGKLKVDTGSLLPLEAVDDADISFLPPNTLEAAADADASFLPPNTLEAAADDVASLLPSNTLLPPEPPASRPALLPRILPLFSNLES